MSQDKQLVTQTGTESFPLPQIFLLAFPFASLIEAYLQYLPGVSGSLQFHIPYLDFIWHILAIV